MIENQIGGVFKRNSRSRRTFDHGLWNSVLFIRSIEDIDMEASLNYQQGVNITMKLNAYRELLSNDTWMVRSGISMPNALHAGPERLSRATSPTPLSCNELRVYPAIAKVVL